MTHLLLVDGVLALWSALEAAPGLRRLVDAILFVEPPIARAATFECPVTALAARRPWLIDEADADLEAFPRARCARWNEEEGGPRCFMWPRTSSWPPDAARREFRPGKLPATTLAT